MTNAKQLPTEAAIDQKSKRGPRRFNKKLLKGFGLGIGVLVMAVYIYGVTAPKNKNQDDTAGQKTFTANMSDIANSGKEETIPATADANQLASPIKDAKAAKPVSGNRYTDTPKPTTAAPRETTIVQSSSSAPQQRQQTQVAFFDNSPMSGAVNVPVYQEKNSGVASDGSGWVNKSGIGAANSSPVATMSGAGGSGGNGLDGQNAFAQAGASGSPKIVASIVSNPELTVPASTIINALLLTAINSDLPGQILGRVTQNVYGRTGKVLLIPQGSVLIGSYNPDVQGGAVNLQVVWKTLKRTDNVDVELGAMNGTNAQGQSGINADLVDIHPLGYVAAIATAAVVTILNGEIINTAKSLYNSEQKALLDQANQQVTSIGAKIADAALAVKPTIYVDGGKAINVFVTKDILLPPCPDTTVKAKYSLTTGDNK